MDASPGASATTMTTSPRKTSRKGDSRAVGSRDSRATDVYRNGTVTTGFRHLVRPKISEAAFKAPSSHAKGLRGGTLYDRSSLTLRALGGRTGAERYSRKFLEFYQDCV